MRIFGTVIYYCNASILIGECFLASLKNHEWMKEWIESIESIEESPIKINESIESNESESEDPLLYGESIPYSARDIIQK